jgi:peroxiredoxin
MFHAVVLLALCVVASPAAYAAKGTVEIGGKAPIWKELPGTDGKLHSLADLKDATAVAVVFTCNQCPVAVAYENRLVKLTEAYKDKGVAVVAINVNSGENLDAMKERAEEKGFNFPYLYDESQASAEQYGATCTPHVFLLDKQRTIAYMGAIDDNMNEQTVEKNHLRDAIEAVLAGKKPAEAVTKQFGCGIKWNKPQQVQ